MTSPPDFGDLRPAELVAAEQEPAPYVNPLLATAREIVAQMSGHRVAAVNAQLEFDDPTVASKTATLAIVTGRLRPNDGSDLVPFTLEVSQ